MPSPKLKITIGCERFVCIHAFEVRGEVLASDRILRVGVFSKDLELLNRFAIFSLAPVEDPLDRC